VYANEWRNQKDENLKKKFMIFCGSVEWASVEPDFRVCGRVWGALLARIWNFVKLLKLDECFLKAQVVRYCFQ
jgi:hypothetical protein